MPNKQIDDFLNAINADAERRRKEIEEATDKYIADETAKAEARISREVYLSLQRRAADIRDRIGREKAGRRAEQREKLFLQRLKLTDELFDEARARIEQAVASEEYAGILTALTAEAVAAVGEHCTVYGRAADEKLICGALPASARFEADGEIALGGVRAVSENGRLAADNTLDSRLEAERERFIKDSKLILD